LKHKLDRAQNYELLEEGQQLRPKHVVALMKKYEE
jgi:hypothetical protein